MTEYYFDERITSIWYWLVVFLVGVACILIGFTLGVYA